MACSLEVMKMPFLVASVPRLQQERTRLIFKMSKRTFLGANMVLFFSLNARTIQNHTDSVTGRKVALQCWDLSVMVFRLFI